MEEKTERYVEVGPGKVLWGLTRPASISFLFFHCRLGPFHLDYRSASQEYVSCGTQPRLG